MYEFFSSLANAVVDRSADELIGAVIIALGISLAFAGLDFLGRRKVRDARMPMIVVMIGANLVSMAFAAGYFVHLRRSRANSVRERSEREPNRPFFVLVESTFRSADKNHDGLLSSEEASVAAAEFVRNADTTGRGSIDASALENAITTSSSYRARRPFGGSFPPPTPGLWPGRRARGFEAGPARRPPSADENSSSGASTPPDRPLNEQAKEPRQLNK
jgi:hypothetical protein